MASGTFPERDHPMSPFRRSAEADAFDAALRGATPSPELEPLLRTVAALDAAADEAPRPQFSADLRERLMAEAGTVLQPRPAVPVAAPSRGTRRRLAGVVATAVTVAGGAGLVASSASALPGEVLYPVKRGTEQVQKSLRLSDSARGAFELQQATRRLAEVEALAERDGSQEQVDEALVDFEKVARSGTDRLMDAYRDDQDKATLQQVDRFVAQAAPTIEDLADGAPGTEDEVVTRVQRLVDELTGTVDRTCPTCLSQESRRLADEVQRRVGGGSEPRSARSHEQVVGRAPSTTPTQTAGRHRSGVRVAIPTTKVPSSGTARHDGRADARARPTAPAPSARPTPGATERPSGRDRAEQRRADRERRAEQRQAEREQRARERQAAREQREAEREQRAEERRAEQRRRAETRRQEARERRREAEERLRRLQDLLNPWSRR
jgi:hypothetical protein